MELTRNARIAWIVVGSEILCGGFGYTLGAAVADNEKKTRAEARQCIAKIEDMKPKDEAPVECERFMRYDGSRGTQLLPSTKAIYKDFVVPLDKTATELRNSFAGYGILGGLVLGWIMGIAVIDTRGWKNEH